MNNSFKSELEEKSTTYTCNFNKLLDHDFYEKIASLILRNEYHNADLKYVFFVNQIISKQIRRFLMNLTLPVEDKVDIHCSLQKKATALKHIELDLEYVLLVNGNGVK